MYVIGILVNLFSTFFLGGGGVDEFAFLKSSSYLSSFS